jgi:hypothetical protein
VVFFIAPLRQRQTCRVFLVGRLMMVVLLTFSLFSTTVLAEPTVAQVEEVCGLVHKPHEVNLVLWSLYFVFLAN